MKAKWPKEWLGFRVASGAYLYEGEIVEAIDIDREVKTYHIDEIKLGSVITVWVRFRLLNSDTEDGYRPQNLIPLTSAAREFLAAAKAQQ